LHRQGTPQAICPRVVHCWQANIERRNPSALLLQQQGRRRSPAANLKDACAFDLQALARDPIDRIT